MENLPKAAIALIEIERSSGIEILAMQRAFHPKDPWSGHWSFPGGKLEDGESALQAAIRETEEEVGIIIKESQLVTDLGIGIAGNHLNRPTTVQSFVFRICLEPTLVLDEEEVRQTSWISQANFINSSNHTTIQPLSHEPEKSFACYPMVEGVLWGFSYGVIMGHWTTKKTT